MSITKKLIIPGALAIAVIVGLAGGSALNASIATADSKTNSTSPPPQIDPAKGGHKGPDGTKETLLTGDNAEKAKTAALKVVTNGTIQRVETDAEGAKYEAHMTKSDGTMVTVKMDANFNVTGTETGPPKLPPQHP